MNNTIPQYSRVVFDPSDLPKEYRSGYPFKEKHLYIYFGEIPNMPGHCIVMDNTSGEFYSGYHIENFIELTPEVEKSLGW